MGDDCRSCQKWEEHIYWSRFQTVMFFQILSRSYNEQLAVPQKFVNNLREKLAGSVALKGPSGAIWNVELTACEEKLYFRRGWKEFVEEHSLRENDVLIFRYNGDSQFDVLMFDQQSCCEKEASYFIRKCGHQELTNGAAQTARNVTPTSHHETNSESSVEVIRETKRRKLSKFGAVEQTSVEQGTQAKREARNISQSKSSTSRLQLISNRRPVTEAEKSMATLKASALFSYHGFTVVMAPGNVYRGFNLTIPADWVRKFLPETERNFDLTLRVKENTWTARCYRRQFGGAAMSGSGYRNFVLENNIEEFDVCVFWLASSSDDIVIEVNIFRVVEEVIPPTRVTQATSLTGNMQGR